MSESQLLSILERLKELERRVGRLERGGTVETLDDPIVPGGGPSGGGGGPGEEHP